MIAVCNRSILSKSSVHRVFSWPMSWTRKISHQEGQRSTGTLWNKCTHAALLAPASSEPAPARQAQHGQPQHIDMSCSHDSSNLTSCLCSNITVEHNQSFRDTIEHNQPSRDISKCGTVLSDKNSAHLCNKCGYSGQRPTEASPDSIKHNDRPVA